MSNIINLESLSLREKKDLSDVLLKMIKHDEDLLSINNEIESYNEFKKYFVTPKKQQKNV